MSPSIRSIECLMQTNWDDKPNYMQAGRGVNISSLAGSADKDIWNKLKMSQQQSSNHLNKIITIHINIRQLISNKMHFLITLKADKTIKIKFIVIYTIEQKSIVSAVN